MKWRHLWRRSKTGPSKASWRSRLTSRTSMRACSISKKRPMRSKTVLLSQLWNNKQISPQNWTRQPLSNLWLLSRFKSAFLNKRLNYKIRFQRCKTPKKMHQRMKQIRHHQEMQRDLERKLEHWRHLWRLSKTGPSKASWKSKPTSRPSTRACRPSRKRLMRNRTRSWMKSKKKFRLFSNKSVKYRLSKRILRN